MSDRTASDKTTSDKTAFDKTVPDKAASNKAMSDKTTSKRASGPRTPDQPENTRRYIFSEAQTRLMFVGSGVLMVATIVGILLLASARPQGKYLEPNRAQYLATLTEATEQLAGGAVNADGTLTLPIEQAMELVAERGVVDPFTVEGAAGQ